MKDVTSQTDWVWRRHTTQAEAAALFVPTRGKIARKFSSEGRMATARLAIINHRQPKSCASFRKIYAGLVTNQVLASFNIWVEIVVHVANKASCIISIPGFQPAIMSQHWSPSVKAV
jgi:hypothetical protein